MASENKGRPASLIDRDSIGMTYNLLNVDSNLESEAQFDPDEIAATKCLLNYNLGPTSIVALSHPKSEKETKGCMVISSEKSRQNMALIAAASRRKMGSLLKVTVDGYNILAGQHENKQIKSFSGFKEKGIPKYLCLFDKCESKHNSLSPLALADRFSFYHRINVRELDASSCINLSEQEFLQYSRSYDFDQCHVWFSRKNRLRLMDKIIGKCEFYCIKISQEMINDIRLVFLAECQSDDCICCQSYFSDVNTELRRGLIQLPPHIYDESYVTKNMENLHVTLETISYLAKHLQKANKTYRSFLSCLGEDRPELTCEQLEIIFPCIFCRILKDNVKWSKSPLFSLLINQETVDHIKNTEKDHDLSFDPSSFTKQDLMPFVNICGGPAEIYDYALNIKKLSSSQSSFRPYTINILKLKKFCVFD